jgi:hypothetical protein
MICFNWLIESYKIIFLVIAERRDLQTGSTGFRNKSRNVVRQRDYIIGTDREIRAYQPFCDEALNERNG